MINKQEIIEIVRDHYYEWDKYKISCKDTLEIVNKLEKLVDMKYIPGVEKKRREKEVFLKQFLDILSQLYDDIKNDVIQLYSIEIKTPPQEYCSSGTGEMEYGKGPDQFITIHTSRKQDV